MQLYLRESKFGTITVVSGATTYVMLNGKKLGPMFSSEERAIKFASTDAMIARIITPKNTSFGDYILGLSR